MITAQTLLDRFRGRYATGCRITLSLPATIVVHTNMYSTFSDNLEACLKGVEAVYGGPLEERLLNLIEVEQFKET